VLDANGVVLLRRALVTADVLQAEGLAYDWVHRNLYWTDAGAGRIEVLSLRNLASSHESALHEMFFRRTLISTGLDQPRAIVLDPRPKHRYTMACVTF